VTASQAGPYSVTVSNSYGSVTSSEGVLKLVSILPEGASFRVISLGTSNSQVIDHDNLTGDDRGGMAASLSDVFYTGDSSSARFDLQDLSNGTSMYAVYDSMAGDLRTATVYLLANTNVPLSTAGGVATHLLELDGITGFTNGNRIALSSPIPFLNFSFGEVAFFSGYGRILVYNSANVYSIALPSGLVTNLGPLQIPAHSYSENWAYWGLAEYFGGTNYLVYVRDSSAIVRTRLPDGLTTTLSTFGNLSDMASFTASLYNSRWYFHHEGSSQFGGSSETLGFADAVFEISQVDHFEWAPIASPQVATRPFTVTIIAKAQNNSTVTNYSGSVQLSGTAVGGGAIGVVSTSSPTFINGVWSGQLIVTQSTAGMVVRAVDSKGFSGASGQFAVYPPNDLFLTMAAGPEPVTVGQVLTYTLSVSNIGPAIASNVILSNFLPAEVDFQSADASVGACANNGGVVRCELQNLDGASGATVTIRTIPRLVGSITNRATLTRSEVDPNPGNDTATVVTAVNLPQLTIEDISTLEGNSGTNFVTFNVRLNASSTNTVTVNYDTFSGTALASSDFVARNGSLTFNPGVTNQAVSVGVRGDTLYETNEFLSVSLNTPVNADLARAVGTCTILNDDPVPTVSIGDATLVEGNSGTNNMRFQVRLSARTGLQILVAYASSNGTAQAGSDYLPVSGTLSFAANSLSQTQIVSVGILGDTTAESNEVFYVSLTSISNALPGNVTAKGTIINEDGFGVLDHFVWSPVPSPQQVSNAFPVTITAKDFFNTTVSNFQGPVTLSGAIGSAQATNVALGDLPVENFSSGNWTLGYAFTPARDITVTHLRHISGTKVSIWNNSGTLLVAQAFTNAPGTWSETALDAPVPLTGGVTYRIAAYTGGGTNFYYWPNNSLGTIFPDGTIDASYEISGDAFPFVNDGVQWWYVDFRYSVGAYVPASLSLTNSGSFSNGFWSGTVTFLSGGSNMTLRARDEAQHRGISAPFDVRDCRDCDGDGILDAWEIAHGLNPSDPSDGALDPDQDGHSNFQEFLAGTDPHSSNSVTRIIGFVLTGDDVRIRFSGVAGKRYLLEHNHALTSSNWIGVASFRLGASAVVDLIDSGGRWRTNQYYRIRLLP